MTILEFGPWILLLLAVALIATAIRAALHKPPRGYATLLFFGTLLGGVSVHGVAFMDPYGKLLASVMNEPSKENYQRALGEVSEGAVPEPYANAIVSAVLSNPTPDLAEMLDQTIELAPSEKGKAKLLTARSKLEQQAHTAQLVEQSLVSTNQLTPEAIRHIEPAVRWQLLEQLSSRPAAVTRLQPAQVAALKKELAREAEL